MSLYYRLPSVDGYDGGLLPLRRFAQFTHQFAGQAAADRASDGRLREFCALSPATAGWNRWPFVSSSPTRRQDVFIGGVFYDLLFSQPLTAPLAITLQPFESTALGVVFSAPRSGSGDVAATARIAFDDGTQQDFDLRATGAVTQRLHQRPARLGRAAHAVIGHFCPGA